MQLKNRQHYNCYLLQTLESPDLEKLIKDVLSDIKRNACYLKERCQHYRRTNLIGTVLSTIVKVSSDLKLIKQVGVLKNELRGRLC